MVECRRGIERYSKDMGCYKARVVVEVKNRQLYASQSYVIGVRLYSGYAREPF